MSDNKQRRQEAMKNLEKEINSRDRSEKMKPLGVVVSAALAIVLIVVGIVFATKYTGSEESIEASGAPTPSKLMPEQNLSPISLARKNPLPETVTCAYNEDGSEAAKKVSLPATDNVPTSGTANVALQTNKGTIDLELDRAVSPCTVNAITHLAAEGYYNDTVCHRLTTSGIKVLQCGDPSGSGAGGPGFQFANEFPTDEATDEEKSAPKIYPRGTIAMANAGVDTNGSQFFLNYGDSPLAPNYTYFGKISESGLKVLDEIAASGTKDGKEDGAPAEEIKIESASVS